MLRRDDWSGAAETLLARPGNRCLETQAKIPGEIDPCVLRNLGNESIDDWATERFCIDGRDMSLWQGRPNKFYRRARVGEIIDNEETLSALTCSLWQNTFQNHDFFLSLHSGIAHDADRVDDPHIELARNNCCRHQPAPCDRHHGGKSPDRGEPPGERPGIAMELVPRDMEGFFGERISWRGRFGH